MIFTHCILKSGLDMEHRPNSRPERTGPAMTYTNTQSRDIGPDEIRDSYSYGIWGLDEYFAIKRAIKQWIAPLHPNYNLIEERINSFTNWPRESPSPKSLSEAGFYFSGKYNSIFISLSVLKKFYNFTYTQNFNIFRKRGYDNLLLLRD